MVTKIPKTKDNLEEFTFEKNDKLNRKPIADNFNKCFENIEGSLVLAINGDWGQGKSAFLHMWKNDLIAKDKEVMYINLWEEDFFKEPFLSIINSFNNKYDDIKKDLINIGKKIGKHILEKKTGINIDNFFDKSIYNEIKEDKIKLKKTIADKVSKNGDNFPLIIMIDELDRCNPLYAIEFLEVMKHFFEIDKVVFILGADVKELSHSIKKIYGDELDTKKYLRKIIDIIYDLPEPKIEVYFNYLLEKYNKKHRKLFDDKIYRSILLNNVTNLRDIEKFFIRYNLTYAEKEKKPNGFFDRSENISFIKNYLLLLNILKPDLYFKIKNNVIDKEDFKLMFDFLGIDNINSFMVKIVYSIIIKCKMKSLSEMTVERELKTIGYNIQDIGNSNAYLDEYNLFDILSMIDFLEDIE